MSILEDPCNGDATNKHVGVQNLMLPCICFQLPWSYGPDQLPWVHLDKKTLENYEDMAYSLFDTGRADDDEDESSHDYEDLSDDECEDYEEIDMEPTGCTNTCSADCFR